MDKIKKILIISGLTALIASVFFLQSAIINPQTGMIVVALVIAVWWMTETIPLYATSLIPLFCYPLLDIMSTKDTALSYMSSTLFVFVGGFLIAHAMKDHGLHRRFAINILRFFGGKPIHIITGFSVSTALLSFWISNTATVVMMLSLALAIIEQVKQRENQSQFTKALLIAIAYSGSIGGLATPIGSPPNLAFLRTYNYYFPEEPAIGFLQWIVAAFPVITILIMFMLLIIYVIYIRNHTIKSIPLSVLRSEYNKLGKLSFAEKRIIFICVLAAGLWIFRSPIPIGDLNIPGWTQLLKSPHYADDGTVAILCAFLLFILPNKKKSYEKILNAHAYKYLPWDTILLFGGGFALARGLHETGVAQNLAMIIVQSIPISEFSLIISSTTFMVFFTELTSNMASIEIMLPILSSICQENNISAFTVLFSTTLASSCAFMLPAATAPNALVFSTGKVSIKDLIFTGFFLNATAVIVLIMASLWWIPLINSL